MRTPLFSFILAFLFTCSLQAADYYVDDDGSNVTGDGSLSKPWKTISYALLKATGKGTIHVAEGTYDVDLGEEFPLVMKDSLSLIGEGRYTTIIDATISDEENTVSKVIYAHEVKDPDTKIEGFRIMGAKSWRCEDVGGIFVLRSSLTIANNTITGINQTCSGGGDYGGAISIRYSNVILENNEIVENDCHGIEILDSDSSEIRNNAIRENIYIDSPGILCERSSPLIEGNYISGNRHPFASYGFDMAGGITCLDNSSATILNNTIIGNSGIGAQAIFVKNSAPKIIGNLIANNYGSCGNAAISIVGNIIFSSDSVYLPVEIYNNTIVGHCCSGIYCENAYGMLIINNIIADNSRYGIKEDENDPSDPNTVAYNLFYNNRSGVYLDENEQSFNSIDSVDMIIPECSNNIYGDPEFVDVENNDFHLGSGSAAIDAGDPGFPADPDQTQADIGALFSEQIIDTIAPGAPQNLKADAGNAFVSLTWTANTESDLSHYILFRRLDTDPGSAVAEPGGTESSYTDMGLSNDITYYYGISAVDISGNASELSQEVSATPTSTSGITYYVSPSGNDEGNGSSASPWKTITHALSQVSRGTILVEEGVYDTNSGDVFPLKMRNGVSIIGMGPEKTILDAEGTGSVIECDSIFDELSKIENFTIKHGLNPLGGGGIRVTGGSNLLIANNVITENYVPVDYQTTSPKSEHGGGIYILESSPSIINNKITGNWVRALSIYSTGSGAAGGGIAILGQSSSPIIENNEITENEARNTSFASALGGGIYISEASPAIMKNNISGNSLYQLSATSGPTRGCGIYITESPSFVISQNIISNNTVDQAYGSVTEGAGIYVSNSSPAINNNVITGNRFGGIVLNSASPQIVNNTISGNDGDGINLSQLSTPSIINNIISFNYKNGIGEQDDQSDPLSVRYNLLYYNEVGTYLDEGITRYYSVTQMNQEIQECESNIEGHPLFVDAVNGDYHLREFSSGIDAGDPGSDYSNEPQPNGDRINIGAYGNTSVAAITTDQPLPESSDYYVDWRVTNQGDGRQSSPWKTITYALSQVYTKGTIHVAEGEYNISLGEVFPLNMKNGVSLVGADANRTVLDAGGLSTVIKCIGITDESTSIEGFTIKSGSNPEGGGGIIVSAKSNLVISGNIIVDNEVPVSYLNTDPKSEPGGGILILDSSPTISNNKIMSNWAGAAGLMSTGSGGYGGGIAIMGESLPIIEHNVITENKAITTSFADALGGGIFAVGGNPIIRNNVISKNSVHQRSATSGLTRGGGIYISNTDSASITGNQITKNTATRDYGGVYDCGGIYIDGASPHISNNIITGNKFGGIELRNGAPDILNNTFSANDQTGIYIGESASPTIINNIFFNNSYGVLSYVGSSPKDPFVLGFNLFTENEDGLYAEEDWTNYPAEYFVYNSADSLNSLEDGCFENLDADPLFVDPEHGDFHLWSGSPCIDAGDPDSPVDADGTRADIGAYYYDHFGPPPEIEPVKCDFNEDGTITLTDVISLMLFLRDNHGDLGGDFNQDGKTNITDAIAMLLAIRYNSCPDTSLMLSSAGSNRQVTRMENLTPDDIEYLEDMISLLNLIAEEEAAFRLALYGQTAAAGLPETFSLSQNSPNPFNPSTTIEYKIPEGEPVQVRLEIYDLRGSLVARLVDDVRESGEYQVLWDGRDLHGNSIASGVYFYSIRAGDYTRVRKMVLLK